MFSWDGAGEDSQKLFSHFRKVAKANNATMTYFLSGVYMLPEEKRDLYHPPQHAPGASEIGFNDEKGIADTAKQVRLAWLEATRSAPTSTATSAARTAGWASGRSTSGRARSPRPRTS